jgi:hypothetical protein
MVWINHGYCIIIFSYHPVRQKGDKFAVKLPDMNNIRPLGGVEKLFMVLDQLAPKTFAMAAELNGHLSEEQLNNFASTIQRRHRQLQAKICVDLNQTNWFDYDHASPVQITILPHSGTAEWKTVLESELNIPFDLAGGPLIRMILICGSTADTLLMLAHHSIGDGFSMVNIFRELFAFLSNKVPAAVIEATSMDQALDLEDRINSPAEFNGTAVFNQALQKQQQRQIFVDHLKLDRETTAAVIEASRKHGITVNGLLNAALAIAIAGNHKDPEHQVISLRTPASVRRTLGIGEEFGLNIITRVSELRIDTSPDIWELGRKVNQDLKNIGNEEETRQYVKQFRNLFLQAKPLDAFVKIMAAAPKIDLMLTNLGRIELEDNHGPLKITGLWGPIVIAGDGTEQTAAALTFDGQLHLTHTSMYPVKDLLKKVCAIVTAQLEQ